MTEITPQFVKALYPYRATEVSGLSFDRGDVIQVLNVLPSGWWDGVLHGRRGWFPSNFVEAVELAEVDDEEDDARSGASVGFMTETSVGSAPTPPEDRTFSYVPKREIAAPVYRPRSADVPILMMSPQTPTEDISHDAADARRAKPRPPPLKLGAGADSGSQNANGRRTGASGPISPARSGHGEVLLFAAGSGAPSPTRRTPLSAGLGSGRRSSLLDYVLSPTRERRRGSLLGSSPVISGRDGDIDVLSQDTGVVHNWSLQMRASVARLRPAAEDGLISAVKQEIEVLRGIVAQVSLMTGLRQFLSSEVDSTMSLDLAGRIVDPSFRTPFRQIVAALSKLTLAGTGLDSGADEQAAVQSLLKDANSLLLYSEQFFAEIEQRLIDGSFSLEPARPVMLANRTTGGAWRNNAASNNGRGAPSSGDGLISEEIVGQLDNLVKSLRSEVQAIKTRIRVSDLEVPSTSSLVVAEVMDLLNSARAFLKSCENLELSQLDAIPIAGIAQSPTVQDFMKTKQLFYDLIADVVVETQHLTSPPVLEGTPNDRNEAAHNLTQALNDLENAMQSTLLHVEFMVQELHSKYLPVLSDQSRRLHKTSALNSPTRPSPTRQLILNRNEKSDDSLTHRLNNSTSTQQSVSDMFVSDPSIPWYLQQDHAQQLILDSKGNIRAGSMPALIERLTRHDLHDAMFNHVFLTTYQCFTTAPQLSAMLMHRWLIDPPEGLTPDSLSVWTERKQALVRDRVFSVFKTWLDQYWMESNTHETQQWLGSLADFATNVVARSRSDVGELLELITRRANQQDGIPRQAMPLPTSVGAPQPIVPRNLKRLKLLEIDALEIARQLTILESMLYGRIYPSELLNKKWTYVIPGEPLTNVKHSIDTSTCISNWVLASVLMQSDTKKRAAVVRHFINIGVHCRQLRNYSTMVAIQAGLNSAPIQRLRRTLELVNSRTLAALEEMTVLSDAGRNYRAYRELIAQATPPCIPFLGMFLTDLCFIADGNKDHYKDDKNLINMAKHARTTDTIRDILQFQCQPYALQSVPEIQAFLNEALRPDRPDNVNMWTLSLEREPREREDEKIARLLQESGFL